MPPEKENSAEMWVELNDKPNAEAAGWQLVSTRYLFKSYWHNLRQDKVIFPDGAENLYTYMDHPGAVFVVPYTVDKRFVLIHTYRITIDDWCWELPAGGLGDRVNQKLEVVACDELEEETGGICGRIEDIGWMYCANGVAKKKIHYFLAHDVVLSSKTKHEPGETIDEIRCFTKEEVLNMIDTGEMRDGDSVLSFFLALRALEKAHAPEQAHTLEKAHTRS